MQGVTLDPLSKASVSRHEQRLEEILQSGPAGAIEEDISFRAKTMSFCQSRIGLAVIASLVIFVVLLMMQPTYIFKKNQDNQRSLVHIDYTLLLMLSAIGGLSVFFIPYLILRQ